MKRTVKDSVFSCLFGDPKYACELYRYLHPEDSGVTEEDCKLICIENTGCSLKEEELPNLFDSFYRGSNSHGVKGNGLGLYICKCLMHKMDGEIFAGIHGKNFRITIVARKA